MQPASHSSGVKGEQIWVPAQNAVNATLADKECAMKLETLGRCERYSIYGQLIR